MNVPKLLQHLNVAALTLLLIGTGLGFYVNGLPGLIELLGQALPIATFFLTISAYKNRDAAKHIIPLILNLLSLAMYITSLSFLLDFHNLTILSIFLLTASIGLVFLANVYFLIKNIRMT